MKNVVYNICINRIIKSIVYTIHNTNCLKNKKQVSYFCTM